MPKNEIGSLLKHLEQRQEIRCVHDLRRLNIGEGLRLRILSSNTPGSTAISEIRRFFTGRIFNGESVVHPLRQKRQ